MSKSFVNIDNLRVSVIAVIHNELPFLLASLQPSNYLLLSSSLSFWILALRPPLPDSFLPDWKLCIGRPDFRRPSWTWDTTRLDPDKEECHFRAWDIRLNREVCKVIQTIRQVSIYIIIHFKLHILKIYNKLRWRLSIFITSFILCEFYFIIWTFLWIDG